MVRMLACVARAIKLIWDAIARYACTKSPFAPADRFYRFPHLSSVVFKLTWKASLTPAGLLVLKEQLRLT